MALQLDLRHYETVVAIIELGTMTAAARQLSTTQSALSHRLADAERRLGVPLFDRSHRRRLRPTRAGLVVHQTAVRALADLQRTEALLIASEDHAKTTVRISVGTYDCFHWYPSFLSAMRAELPSVQLELTVVGDAPGAALAGDAVDLVIAPGRPEGHVDRHHVLDDELVAVFAPQHPLAGRSWLSAEDLADEMYLTYNSAPSSGFEYDRFIRAAEVYPRFVNVVPQISAIVELVAAGAGMTILSRWALSPVLDSGRIVAVSCGEHGLPLSWSAVYRADESLDSPARSVGKLLAQRITAP